jgi:hypothetical protein
MVREFADEPNGIWTRSGPTAVTVLNDDGIRQTLKVTVPEGPTGKRFVRLRVSWL